MGKRNKFKEKKGGGINKQATDKTTMKNLKGSMLYVLEGGNKVSLGQSLWGPDRTI